MKKKPENVQSSNSKQSEEEMARQDELNRAYLRSLLSNEEEVKEALSWAKSKSKKE